MKQHYVGTLVSVVRGFDLRSRAHGEAAWVVIIKPESVTGREPLDQALVIPTSLADEFVTKFRPGARVCIEWSDDVRVVLA